MTQDAGGDADGARRDHPRPPAGLDRSLPHPPARPLRVAIAAGVLVLAAAAAVAAALVGFGPARADRALLDEALDARSGSLTALATAVTEVGSTAAMGLLAVVTALWLLGRGRGVDAAFLVVTAGGAGLVFTGLKRLLDRPRPPAADRLIDVANESLPSGHATMSMAVVGALVTLAWAGRSARGRAAVVVAAAVWVGAVGATRIYLGVHWFSDVLAGWLVGGAWLALCVTAWSLWRTRRASAVPPSRARAPGPRRRPPSNGGTGTRRGAPPETGGTAASPRA